MTDCAAAVKEGGKKKLSDCLKMRSVLKNRQPAIVVSILNVVSSNLPLAGEKTYRERIEIAHALSMQAAMLVEGKNNELKPYHETYFRTILSNCASLAPRLLNAPQHLSDELIAPLLTNHRLISSTYENLWRTGSELDLELATKALQDVVQLVTLPEFVDAAKAESGLLTLIFERIVSLLRIAHEYDAALSTATSAAEMFPNAPLLIQLALVQAVENKEQAVLTFSKARVLCDGLETNEKIRCTSKLAHSMATSAFNVADAKLNTVTSSASYNGGWSEHSPPALQGNRCNIPRFNGLSAEKFQQEYAARNLPVIVSYDAIKQWPAKSEWKKKNFLKKYGKLELQVTRSSEVTSSKTSDTGAAKMRTCATYADMFERESESFKDVGSGAGAPELTDVDPWYTVSKSAFAEIHDDYHHPSHFDDFSWKPEDRKAKTLLFWGGVLSSTSFHAHSSAWGMHLYM
jgi:hypothetical protein